MKLKDLLAFDDIVIQCHDNPDADALASGYGVYYYLKKMGKKPRFIYRGINKITKSNMLLMLSELEIPVTYEPDFDEVPELLINVDCQHGQRNVTNTEAKTIAIIDHHQVAAPLPELSEVRSQMGSCSTVVWDMLRQEGIDISEERALSTAFYYGLYTDTNRMAEVSHPLDRDMIDSLIVNKSLIREMSNSNISLDELKITGQAILNYEYVEKHRYMIIKAEACDPGILGVISDFAMETAEVDACLAFYERAEETKFSVRCCVKEVHANELASFLAEGLGGGGGHLTKAGGNLRPEKIDAALPVEGASSIYELLKKRMDAYFDKYEIIYAKTDTVDTSDMKFYEKQPQYLGYVKLTDVFPLHTVVEIRTLEGDVNVRLDGDKYLMIGLEGEVYPITKEKLESSYKETGTPYERNFEYEPSVKDMFTGKTKKVIPYAREVVSTGQARIYARPLTTYVKLFTAWDEEKYYTGNPGDYIAVREDDPHDIYIIKGRLFDQLYKEI